MIASRQNTHLTRVISRIHILHRFAHGCVGTASGKHGWVGPLRETAARGSELPMHVGKHRGRHCTGTGHGVHNQKARHCTGYVIPTKQKGFAEIECCAVAARGVARGNARDVARPIHAICALKTSKPSMLAACDFQHFLGYTREEEQPIPCKI